MWSRYADHVIAVCEKTAQWLSRGFGVGRNKISVIGNGYEPCEPKPQTRTNIRKKLGLTKQNIAVLFVGRGEDVVKGTELVARAIERLHRKNQDVRLVAIPGTGFERADWLCATGPIDHTEITDYYHAADIFANASLSEGMPLTIVEAAAAGLPIVAAPVGGIVDFVKHNQTGLLTRPDRSDLAEQLGLLISAPDIGLRLAGSAKRTAKNLTWANLAGQTIAIYESLIAQPQGNSKF